MTATEQGVYTTFTCTCPCGETVHVVDTQEQPHTCRPITVQMLRDAYADGYTFARDEARRARLHRRG